MILPTTPQDQVPLGSQDGRFWKPTPPTTCIGFNSAGRKENPMQCIVQFEETHPGKDQWVDSQLQLQIHDCFQDLRVIGIGKSTCLAESAKPSTTSSK
ncbi:hypothetical protein YC2023_100379 [Brassica napus]